MANPFKPDDKVITKQQGKEIVAVVRLIYNDEVQVRTPDGVLRWRTAKTVWFPEQAQQPVEPDAPSIDQEAPLSTAAEITDVGSEAPVEQPSPESIEAAEEPIPEQEEGVGEPSALEPEPSEPTGAGVPVEEEVLPQTSVQTPPLVDTRLEYGPCGVPETMAQRRRNRKGGRRR